MGRGLRGQDGAGGEHTAGASAQGRLIVVSHAEYGDIIRIMSTRWATRVERSLHEEEGQG
jgi:uncharacterized DUF497 family protein